jgi:hypothetical protein
MEPKSRTWVPSTITPLTVRQYFVAGNNAVGDFNVKHYVGKLPIAKEP